METSRLLIQGDARRIPIAEGSVHTAITSPPYFGLRDYGVGGQIGLEATPEAYVAQMVEVFREVRRVLRDDGTLWLNIGDSYCASPPGNKTVGVSAKSTLNGIDSAKYRKSLASGHATKMDTSKIPGLKPKDLIGIPWRLAFALQADGWYLRSEIVWHKSNPMPESVSDRPSRCHEQIFLLAKSERYFYDAEAVKEPVSPKTLTVGTTPTKGSGVESTGEKVNLWMEKNGGRYNPSTRNKRTVWTIAARSFKGAHFATFPPKLVEPCIKAGTSEKGCCPACGAQWKRLVKKVRTATRPGRDTKVDGAEGDHAVVGNRGPRRHVTETETIGWAPGCKCDAGDPVPCRVFDPFGGAMTTVAVAEWLGRVGIATELKSEYLDIGKERSYSPGPDKKPKPQIASPSLANWFNLGA